MFDIELYITLSCNSKQRSSSLDIASLATVRLIVLSFLVLLVFLIIIMTTLPRSALLELISIGSLTLFFLFVLAITEFALQALRPVLPKLVCLVTELLTTIVESVFDDLPGSPIVLKGLEIRELLAGLDEAKLACRLP
jgi:hypothetical protein